MDRSTYGDLLSESQGYFIESSTVTGNYHEIVEEGGILPNNPYYWYRYDAEHPWSNTYNGVKNEHMTRSVKTMKGTLDNSHYSAPTPQTLVKTTEKKNDAIVLTRNKLIEKATNVEIDLGVALGEFGETCQFVSNVITKTVGVIRDLKRGDPSSALRLITDRNKGRTLRGAPSLKSRMGKDGKPPGFVDLADVAANTQLTASYAITPLMSDVHAALEILDNGLRRPKYLAKIIRASSKGVVDVSDIYVPFPGVKDDVYTSRVYADWKCHAKFTYYVKSPLAETFSAVGLTNPLSIVWDLTTLSFVVDWFVPVGKYLQSINPPPGMEAVDGYVYYKARGFAQQTTDLEAGWHTWFKSRETLKERQVFWGWPDYELIIPDLSLSKRQVADGIALLWSFLT